MTVLRHAVGKSTLNEGFSVPRSLEGWIQAPEAGLKRTIYLEFAGQRVPATLRRIANAVGHVQVKYDNAAGQPFRDWLVQQFPTARRESRGEYIEVARMSSDEFRVTPSSSSVRSSRHLEVNEWLFHRTDRGLLEQHSAVREIPAIINSIEFNKREGQSYYNRAMTRLFAEWQWEAERQVVPELPLRCDFAKDTVQVEVEFGNARTYYQDFIKFMLAFNQKTADVGVLIVPSVAFARQLCNVGKQRAKRRGGRSYSGMIHIEKVRRELEFLKFMLTIPIAIAGIGLPPPPTLFDQPTYQ